MQEHDRQKLARFSEDESYIVDMRERGIAEGRREGGGNGDEDERDDDAAVGEDGCDGRAGGCVEAEIEVAAESCEERLDCVEEDWELEFLRGGEGAVGRGCETFLEDGPSETVEVLVEDLGRVE